ncbi:hypothetical protein H0B56_16445 [Haloechinothrix sp. YIM 98757]|uniref:Uncharacterized protein n=1 Tax=Haloechinothrix aidingensis TaxID=2752311 RepID=A0A838AD47_9PSEU|nr:hypothetical protein [Haloechinothrix aidingensis]MBA0127141.1 hypothetical protein [Haloechinothrix aidingensis]
MEQPRVIAVDWSGRKGPEQRRAIWLAEAAGGRLTRLESGRTRDQLVDFLIAEAQRDPGLIVGIDFAFSLPAWYLRERGYDARRLWAALAGERLTPRMRQVGLAEWVTDPEPPFWTKAKSSALAPEQEFRRTEDESRASGAHPKSVFQLVGAGQVGCGSLYGMQALHRLSEAGFHVWPFDPAGMPVVVEIFPRLLTGPVSKSSPSARQRYLSEVPVLPEFRERAAENADAFDAAISALAMADAVDEPAALPAEPEYTLEGKIWRPGTKR